MSRTCPRPPCPRACSPRPRTPHTGFTLVSVVFVLVVLTALGAALATLSQRQQMASAAGIDSARALQAARAGLEWAAHQVLRNPPPPAAAPACPATTHLQPAGLGGFTVSVTCTRTPGSGTVPDGATELVFYELTATACNAPSGGACPGAGTPRPTYAERQLRWTLVR